MKMTLLLRPMALLQPRREATPALHTAPDGQSALLAFPRFPDLSQSEAFDALDAWLADHPTCSVVLLNELPTGRALRRLQWICKRRGCAYMVRACRPAAVA